MTQVSFVKTTESYNVSLVSISWQTLYGSGILHQDNRIIRDLPMDHTRFADWVSIWVVHLIQEQTKVGGPNYSMGPDCAGNG